MIYSKDVLFIHVPKTGGMAVTDLLLKVLPRPVCYSHPHEADPALPPDIIQFIGDRHESLPEARDILAQRGCTLEQFRLILAVIRNPYAIEVSRCCYLQNGNPVDRGHNQDHAVSGDFEAFARDSDDHGDGVRPVEKCWEDEWVSGRLRFPVRIEKPAAGLHLKGVTPHLTSTPTELALKIGAREFRQTFPPNRDFAWQISCPLAAHEAVEVELNASPTFRPCAVDASLSDIRELAFRLQHFEFQPAVTP